MKKHILCIGDSNTHGYCADPDNCSDGGIRFNENERWTSLLQNHLGSEYLVIEEGLSGRTTVFPDPLHESMDALSVIYPLLKSHESIDLLIIMLGTNDTKERFSANAPSIALGMERLVRKAITVDCWGEKEPNILVIAPPKINTDVYKLIPAETSAMGAGYAEKSQVLAKYYAETVLQLNQLLKDVNIHFMDADGCEFNKIDYMHLTKNGHLDLASRLAELIPNLC